MTDQGYYLGGKNYPMRILMVDDDPILREFGSIELAVSGCTVQTAADGMDGLDQLRALTFEVMVLDLEMPRMDGFGVLQVLSELDGAQKPAVIVLTSRTDVDSLSRAFELGAVAYALKPVDWPRLRRKVQQAFEGRRADEL